MDVSKVSVDRPFDLPWKSTNMMLIVKCFSKLKYELWH